MRFESTSMCEYVIKIEGGILANGGRPTLTVAGEEALTSAVTAKYLAVEKNRFALHVDLGQGLR